VLASLGRDLEVRQTKSIGLLRSLLLSDFPKLSVNLVAHQEDEALTSLILIV
jgi:hypothetical protein